MSTRVTSWNVFGFAHAQFGHPLIHIHHYRILTTGLDIILSQDT